MGILFCCYTKKENLLTYHHYDNAIIHNTHDKYECNKKHCLASIKCSKCNSIIKVCRDCLNEKSINTFDHYVCKCSTKICYERIFEQFYKNNEQESNIRKYIMSTNNHICKDNIITINGLVKCKYCNYHNCENNYKTISGNGKLYTKCIICHRDYCFRCDKYSNNFARYDTIEKGCYECKMEFCYDNKSPEEEIDLK